MTLLAVVKRLKGLAYLPLIYEVLFSNGNQIFFRVAIKTKIRYNFTPQNKWTVGRVVEGARLEREYGASHRGFESLIVHHFFNLFSFAKQRTFLQSVLRKANALKNSLLDIVLVRLN